MSNSVRYFGARSMAFVMKAVCCSALSSGGAVVRVTAIANIRQYPEITHSLLQMQRLPIGARPEWNLVEPKVGFCDRRGSDECTIRPRSPRQQLMQRA